MFKKKKISEDLMKLINKSSNNGNLLSVVYSNGEIGKENAEKVEVDLVNLKLKTILKQEKNIKIEKKEYSINKKDRIKIKSIVKKYNFSSWINLPMGDLLALDAPTKTITFYYDNSKSGGNHLDSYTINYYSRIPKDGYQYLKMLTDYIFSLENEKKEIK